MQDVLSEASKNGKGCFVPACFVLHSCPTINCAVAKKTCQTSLNLGASMTSKYVLGVSDKVTAGILARNLKFCS